MLSTILLSYTFYSLTAEISEDCYSDQFLAYRNDNGQPIDDMMGLYMNNYEWIQNVNVLHCESWFQLKPIFLLN